MGAIEDYVSCNTKKIWNIIDVEQKKKLKTKKLKRNRRNCKTSSKNYRTSLFITLPSAIGLILPI